MSSFRFSILFLDQYFFRFLFVTFSFAESESLDEANEHNVYFSDPDFFGCHAFVRRQ